MARTEEDELGPIDMVVIGFPSDAPVTGEAVSLLVELVDRGTIRVIDVLFVAKDADGGLTGHDARGMGLERLGDFAVFDGATTGVIGDDDVAVAAEAIDPGTTAAIIVYENAWAAPFAAAVRRGGGRLLATERVSLMDLIEALDAAEAAGATQGGG